METRRKTIVTSLLLMLLSVPSFSLAYRPGEIVPMSKMSQYHNSRTVWHDVIGKHCPVFAVNREVLIPIAKPTGFTGADPVKISFQVGRENFLIPWLFVINRKSSQVPMIDMHLRYSGSDILGVTAKIVDMPQRYVEIHPDVPKYFWKPESWPKHVLSRYTWEEQSEIDVASGFYVLFGSEFNLEHDSMLYDNWRALFKHITEKYFIQANRAHAVFYSLNLHFAIISGQINKETVTEGCMPGGRVAKVE